MPGRPHFFLSVLSFLLLGAAGLAAGVGYGAYLYLSPGPLEAPQLVLIERGSGVSKISQTLEDQNVITHALLFKVAARLTGLHGSLKAGEYQFPAGVSVADALLMLHEGDVYDRKVTIPEGLTSYQIVQILAGVDELQGEVPDIPPEGSLLPETYRFVTGDTKAGKLREMQSAMDAVLAELWPARAEGLPFETKEQALVLASIVEKETAVPSERARIAGVFVNRLKRGIPLQTDPSVIYALTQGKVKNEGQGPLGRRLLLKDLKTDSPYNTYRYAGLPPGPIANPGRASLEATLHPEAHEYVYFVADGTGGHVFAKSLAEHNRNVLKWRKIRRNR
ncbi:MAG: endolytic transglycosylase MltG [Rhodospirillales bacterium]|nr:endolytic transglycosylase MltG [Alphaproteobacteria bacterium]USO04425.1 MAG: endolytic transglycosylase MltG [Rhodospirillales bacterium]